MVRLYLSILCRRMALLATLLLSSSTISPIQGQEQTSRRSRAIHMLLLLILLENT